MATVINLRKKRGNWWKIPIVILTAVVLTTVGIKASDYLARPAGEEAAGACPAGMVAVVFAGGDFCLDQYEAAVGENCPFVAPGSLNDSQANVADPACQAVSAAGREPWRFVSQDQARLACAKAGKRLPTNAEWTAAALGTPDFDSGWKADDCQVANNWPAQPGLTKSGENCRSPAGAYDLIGNLWEWTDETVRDGWYEDRELPPAGYIDGTDGQGWPAATVTDKPPAGYFSDYFWIKKSGVKSVARGGYWDNGKEAGAYAAYIVLSPAEAGTGLGFRCAK